MQTEDKINQKPLTAKERSRAYYQRNREKVIKRVRIWQENNRERKLETNRQYYYNNKEKWKDYNIKELLKELENGN